MKIRTLALALAVSSFAFCSGPLLRAQEGEIKVTTTLHADGSRTDAQIDTAAGTSEEKTYDAAGKLTRRVVYKLNETGQPAEGTAYSPKDEVLYLFGYTRDSQGRIAEERDTTSAGALIQRFVYRYDSQGHVAGIDAFDAQGNLLNPAGASRKKPARSRR